MIRWLPYLLVSAWGFWIVGTPFHLPFVLADEGDGYYFCQQIMDFRNLGLAGLHVNHPPFNLWYLDLFTRMFGEGPHFKETTLRLAMIVFSLGTGLVIYEMAWLMIRRRFFALLAGLAVFYIPVFSLFSQRVSHEAPTGFFIALTFYFHLRVLLDADAGARRRALRWGALSTALGCLFNFPAYFLAVSWALIIWKSPPQERRTAILWGGASFLVPALFTVLIGVLGHPQDYWDLMFGTAQQRMTFGANPSGQGEITAGQWFWYVYKKRLGWISPVAYAACVAMLFAHRKNVLRWFYGMMLTVAHLNIFVFSTGAFGWICYFYFFAFPFAIAPWDLLAQLKDRWWGHRRRLFMATCAGVGLGFFAGSQIIIKQAFTTAGSQIEHDRYGDELARLDKWFVTKPDFLPLYAGARDAVLKPLGITRSRLTANSAGLQETKPY